ncbi:MAG: FAD-dependent monooxygenase [Kutzneria sp.]|nr:FAD-dependent monooxygenase [Kutzneria sp.]
MPLTVLIAGGGIGGLALANGLRQAGVHATVYERDPSPRLRRQGYRIHIDADGGQALRRCLPENLFLLYQATSHRPTSARLSVVDYQLHQLSTLDTSDPDFDPATAHTAVNRLTLRQIMLGGLDGAVRFDRRVIGVDQNRGGVTLRFDDGGTAHGDVLIAADGVNSVIRRQLLPHSRVTDTGLRAVYGTMPLAAARRGRLPQQIEQGFTAIIGPRGRTMAAALMRQRTPVAEAVAELAPGLEVDSFTDYLMWVLVAPLAEFGLADEQLRHAESDTLWRIAQGLTEDWHPDIRGVIADAEVPNCFSLAIRSCLEVPELSAAPVTLLGDAIHAMPPAGGAGANTALRDAALLTERLAAVNAGTDSLPAALADYATRMRDYATGAVRLSLRNSGLEYLLP